MFKRIWDEARVKIKITLEDRNDPRIPALAERLRSVAPQFTSGGGFKTHGGLAAWFVSIERRTGKPVEQNIQEWAASQSKVEEKVF